MKDVCLFCVMLFMALDSRVKARPTFSPMPYLACHQVKNFNECFGCNSSIPYVSFLMPIKLTIINLSFSFSPIPSLPLLGNSHNFYMGSWRWLKILFSPFWETLHSQGWPWTPYPLASTSQVKGYRQEPRPLAILANLNHPIWHFHGNQKM